MKNSVIAVHLQWHEGLEQVFLPGNTLSEIVSHFLKSKLEVRKSKE